MPAAKLSPAPLLPMISDFGTFTDGCSTTSQIEFVADRPGHDMRYAIDSTKLERELGIVPQESFDSGLRKTVQWYLNNREWTERVRSGAYRGQRLGLADR